MFFRYGMQRAVREIVVAVEPGEERSARAAKSVVDGRGLTPVRADFDIGKMLRVLREYLFCPIR